ncbi:MAG TPA: hypothetical protein VIL42_10730 [Sphingomicrobium sp.]|jgi:hypothetical protein
MPAIVTILQIVSGGLWFVVAMLFVPAVTRIWRSPRHGPARPDPIDVIVSPLAFVGFLQAGFVIRWLIFPDAIAVMSSAELVVWAGLYTLSTLGALGAAVAWRIARGLR